MHKILVVDAEKLAKIKEHYDYCNMATEHAELFNEKDRQDYFEQWRGMRYILRNLGLLDLMED